MIFTIIAIVLIGSVGIGFALSQKLRDLHIQKKVVIKGPVEGIFEQVAYLKNFPNWSPFLEADPSQEVEVKGTDGKIGAQYHWLGNKGKDLGYQEIKAIKPLEYIRLECDIQKPFQAQPVFEYNFQQTDESVSVIQKFSLKSGAIDAFFMWLFGGNKDIEKINERGLELLKIAVEKQSQAQRTLNLAS